MPLESASHSINWYKKKSYHDNEIIVMFIFSTLLKIDVFDFRVANTKVRSDAWG